VAFFGWVQLHQTWR